MGVMGERRRTSSTREGVRGGGGTDDIEAPGARPGRLGGRAPLTAPALALAALVSTGASCGGGATPPAASAKAAGAAASASARRQGEPAGKGAEGAMVTPSRLLPDLVGDRGVVALEDGHRRVLVDRMRVIAHEDGSIERAAELLPIGQVTAITLPSRLGGGYLFHASSRGGTMIWRAASWLGKLDPLVQLSSEASEVIPGFDRLYVRLSQNNRLVAVDVESGEAMPLGPLPPAGAYGQIAFADGWRALVEADLRGPLATFDAGTTWRPVRVDRRPNAVSVIGGDPALVMADGYYAVDARGGITFRPLGGDGAPQDSPDPAPRPPGPFGRRPLRAAVEDGWPDSKTTAVVARGGALARVSLRDGAVIDVAPEAYRDKQAFCHAVRMGAGKDDFGFVCGERDGATALYAFEAPLAMREVMRFRKPRFIAPSGNGALVVRGPCGDEAPAAGVRTYCVLAPEPEGGGARLGDGAVVGGGVGGASARAGGAVVGGFRSREIRVKAASQDMGVERVVALVDGRVAVLVPPRAGAAGQLTLLRGNEATSLALTLPAKPRSAARELRRGMWLEGFEEREPGYLGGWVEAGGPILGVRVNLKDGNVQAGELRQDATGAILSGRFAISLGEGDLAAESTDGGMSWTPFDLPERDVDPGASPTRACGPVGCAFKGWIRVGWGKPGASDDLAQAEAPPMLYTPLRNASTLSLQCDPLGSSTPPLPEKPAPRKGQVGGVAGAVLGGAPPGQGRISLAPHVGVLGVLGGGGLATDHTTTAWLPFRNTSAPALGKDEVGFDNGAPYDIVAVRAYAWGKKGADWTRAGRWMIRFDDRFDPAGGVRSSAVSASPWADEGAAAEAIGGYSYGMATWGAFLDPGGRAALAQSCRGAGCELFAVIEGQPVLPLRDGSGRASSLLRPLPNAAVRDGETWYYLTPGGNFENVALWRADLGLARQVATYDRPTRSGHATEPPRLVRRAAGGGVGLLVSMPPDPGARSGSWHVLPIDPSTGELGEAIALGRKDLTDAPLARCAPGQDGWIFDTSLEATPNLDLGGTYGSIDSTELRLRMDPGMVCIDSVAVRIQGAFAKEAGAPRSGARAGEGIPLAATERQSGRRWSMKCWRPNLVGVQP